MNTIKLSSSEALALVDTLAAYRTLLWASKDRLALTLEPDTGKIGDDTYHAIRACFDSIEEAQTLTELIITRLER